MATTDIQKRTAQGIVNVFETGRVAGDYACITLLPGDSGRLTYGRSQVTLGSGNLHLLIKTYCETEAAAFAPALALYLGRLATLDAALDQDTAFRCLLHDAGQDPVMQDVQDAFFDRVFWAPSETSATNLGITSALGTAVVYDSFIHGSWGRMRDRTNAQKGAPGELGPDNWIRAYVSVRREWLANHSEACLRRTVYRMDAFQSLIDAATWALPLPLNVRGVRIDEDSLSKRPLRPSAEEDRTLRLVAPYLEGEDVKAVQEALKSRGFAVEVDRLYGPATEAAVRLFQEQAGLKADGIVGPVTRVALGL
jgi:chitosanase